MMREARALAEYERGLMTEQPYALDEERRQVVLRSIQDVCTKRTWPLIAAHIREEHAHAVMDLDSKPERALGDLKAYSTIGLKSAGLDVTRQKRWANGGSTIPLRDRPALLKAIAYVIEGQGQPMAVYLDPEFEGS